MNDFIRKHKGKLFVLVIVVFIVLFPILLNLTETTQSLVHIAGEPNDWIQFWGSYAGSLITSGIALVILFMQMKQNHQENERNRKLQQYQQKMQWLNDMRTACIENIYSYNVNDLIQAANTMQGSVPNLYEAYKHTDAILFKLATTDTKVAFIGENHFDYQKDFHKKRGDSYKEYYAVVYDFKAVIAQTINVVNESNKNNIKKNAKDYWDDLLKKIDDMLDVSSKIKERLKKHDYEESVDISLNLCNVIIKYLDDCKNYFEEVREFTQSYLNKEQKKIKETLLSENDMA